jgi:transposase-like protein
MSVGWFAEQVGACEPDLLRQMVKTMAEALMSAEADAICGAGYGEGSEERLNRRNGYREREWDTRVGTVELAIPKLRSGSYFPERLLERRRRVEQALVSVVATSYLLGVSTRRVDKLVDQLGIKGISKSQVSQAAGSGSGKDRLREYLSGISLLRWPYGWIAGDAGPLRRSVDMLRVRWSSALVAWSVRCRCSPASVLAELRFGGCVVRVVLRAGQMTLTRFRSR